MKKDKKRGNITIVFATGNPNKVHEIRLILKEYPITIEERDQKGREIQSEDLEEVAEASVLWAVEKIRAPTIVEDSGLFIDALRGFPGTSTAYVYKTIGKRGVLKLLEDEINRTASFKSAIAYSAPREKPRCFLGEVHGRISLKERGARGFGFDPIFESEYGQGRTFGEIEVEEKNRYSHRAIAVRRFAEWLIKNKVAHRDSPKPISGV